jgi:hypothetical protein
LGHTELGFHNAVIDAASGKVADVFDFDRAAYCDAHHDFRYFLLDDEDEALLEAALKNRGTTVRRTFDPYRPTEPYSRP